MSTLSAYFICSYNNYPFINPSLTDEQQNLKINEYIKNVPILIIQSTSLMYFVSNNFVQYNDHTLFQSFYTLGMYFLCIEAIYYVYHRLIHKKHHTNIIVYPFDTFFLTELDDLASIVSIGLPILFIKVSMFEQFIILYLYITSSYLSHSNLFWSHHYIHHKLFIYNFCILFPIFDIIFGTYKRVAS